MADCRAGTNHEPSPKNRPNWHRGLERTALGRGRGVGIVARAIASGAFRLSLVCAILSS